MFDKKEWFRQRKWGVFCHYLNALQNSGTPVNCDGKATSWDECVNELDAELLARQLCEAKAGYLVFTIMQCTRQMIAPNATYDRLTGYAPGEACATRDLIADLIAALKPYGIPLFLYYTGDGPRLDAQASERMDTPGCRAPGASEGFVEGWTSVLREYSLRYGENVRGWWVDGLYQGMYPGADNPLIGRYRDAALAGNPNALFSANYYGCAKTYPSKDVPGYGNVIFGDFYHEIAAPTKFCDYTAGEVVNFDAYPQARDVEGAVPHVLSFLGIPDKPLMVYDGWGRGGTKFTPEYMRRYVRCVNDLGGVVSIDCCLHRDGRIDAEQMNVLRALASLNA